MKSKEKLRMGLIISALVVVIVAVIVLYAMFMQNQIFEESSNHLSEIYGQTNAFFNGRISSHRNLLRSWEEYIKDVSNDPAKRAEFQQFIDEQKELLNVTRFSFINVHVDSNSTFDGNDWVLAKDRDGRVYQLELRRSIKDAFGYDRITGQFDSDNDGMAVACLRHYGTERALAYNDDRAPREDYVEDNRYMMIAMQFSTEATDYYVASEGDKEFYYNGIAFFFNVEDIQYALETNAFDHQGSCFLVLPYGVQDDSKGLVLLQNSEVELFKETAGTQWNFYDFLRNKTNLNESQIKSLENKWLDIEEPGTITFKVEGTEYYLNYRAISEYNDWVLAGVVPANIVNASMTRLRALTIGVMAVIFAIVGGGVAWFLVSTSNRRVKDKELVIKSREGLFDLLTLNTNDIFALFDSKTGVAEYVSKNVETVLGLNLEDVKNNVYNVMSASVENIEELTKYSASEAEDGIVVDQLQMKNVKNQSEYWYRLGINPTESKSTRYVMMLSDRTKERDMRADLESALEIAKSANEAKSNFLSNMSHDIRTPMNAIIGFATLCAKDADNPVKVREYIRKISFSSNHLLSLINDILDMSKIESGKSALHVAEFSLPELLEELNSIIISQVQSKKQKFEVRTKGILPEHVYGDKLRLNQVIINLLSNAVKYTPAGGEITLTVEALEETVRNHAHLRFSVKDNGLGMSEEFVKVIFEPFSRETTDAKREIQGTGLGMAITKQIVDLMGGTIIVNSKRGEGSEFIVEIELAKVVQKHDTSNKFWKEHDIRKMLVVDDEEDVCIEVKELMSDTGVEVEYVTSGQQAIDKVKAMKEGKVKYDIVLLDWKMPEMDGLEAAKHIRELVHDELPIMVLTSYNFEEIEEDAEKSGIHVFLQKPFFVSSFRNAVASLHNESEEEEQVEEDSKDEFSMEGLNILAAEDNPINAEILEELLDIEGATCTIAENGQVAVETFEKSEPGTYNLIFMDVQMPVMNGHQAAKAIRESSHPDAKKIPIIAMTANAFDDDKKMAYDAGMNAHVAKPINMDLVKKTVEKVLGGKK